MDPIIVLLLVVIAALAFYIHQRGQEGVKTDIANARAESSAALDDIKTHVMEAKAHVLAAVAPRTIITPGPAAEAPPAVVTTAAPPS